MYRGCYLSRLLMLCTLVLCLVIPFSANLACSETGMTQGKCLEKTQEFLASGNIIGALEVLEKAVPMYPESELLHTYYGRALYLNGRINEAEEQFRKALDINRNSDIAKFYVKEMRKTQDLLQDREMSEWKSIAKDKLGDIVVIILGVWIGTLLTRLSERFAISFKKSSFEKAFRKGNEAGMVDSLENLFLTAKKADLRKNMLRMLERYDSSKVEQLIIDHVHDDDIERKMLFFFQKVQNGL